MEAGDRDGRPPVAGDSHPSRPAGESFDEPELEAQGRYYERPRAASAAVAGSPFNYEHDPDDTGTDSSRGRLVTSWYSWKRAWDLKRAAEGSPMSPAESQRRPKPSPGKTAPAKRHRERHHHFTVSAGALPEALYRDGPEAARERRNAVSDDNVGGLGDEGAGSTGSVQPRKVVSLLLRRKSNRPPVAPVLQRDSARALNDSTRRPGERVAAGHGSPKRKGFRRVQSQLHPPVSKSSGGEGGRYLEYAAELDDDSFERLVEFTKQIALERKRANQTERGATSDESASQSPEAADASGGQIIGEIRLEDYAEISDGESDDMDFLNDAESGELGSPDNSSRAGSRGVRMDNQKLTWIGDEAEFAAFFADFGFDDILFENGSSEVHAADFDVGPGVLQEWTNFICDHNETCGAWANSLVNKPSTLDIRNLAWN